MSIRIVMADDHRIVLDGLQTLLNLEDDMEVVGTAVNGKELLEMIPEVEPDVIIFDQRMPEMSGLEVLSTLRETGVEAPTVLLAGTLGDEEVFQALQLNVQGIVLKESASSTIRECVRRVHGGGRWWPPEVMQRALDTAFRDAAETRSLSEALTRRELDIIRHVAAGQSNKRIAAALSISEGTVKTHLHSIFKKVGVANRVQLTLFAQEEGLDTGRGKKSPA